MCSREQTDGGALARGFQLPELRGERTGKPLAWVCNGTRVAPHAADPMNPTWAGAAHGLTGHGRRRGACLGGAGRTGTWLWGGLPLPGLSSSLMRHHFGEAFQSLQNPSPNLSRCPEPRDS